MCQSTVSFVRDNRLCIFPAKSLILESNAFLVREISKNRVCFCDNLHVSEPVQDIQMFQTLMASLTTEG